VHVGGDDPVQVLPVRGDDVDPQLLAGLAEEDDQPVLAREGRLRRRGEHDRRDDSAE
jgi:hypothetical protein